MCTLLAFRDINIFFLPVSLRLRGAP